jgi:hypothetical protein
MEIELLYGPKYVYKLNMVFLKNCSTLGQENKPIIEKKTERQKSTNCKGKATKTKETDTGQNTNTNSKFQRMKTNFRD